MPHVQRRSLTTTPSSAIVGNPVVQRRLDEDIKLGEFIERLAIKGTVSKELRASLLKLLTAAKDSTFQIEVEWLVEQVNSKKGKAGGLSRDAVDSLTAKLPQMAGRKTETELSGEGGHEITRHVLVDRESQEKRLETISKATRVKSGGKHGERYRTYLDTLKNRAPGLIKEHVEKVCHEVFIAATDTNFHATNASNAAKKAHLQALINKEVATTYEEEDFTVQFEWRVAVTGPGLGFGVSLTCEPEIESNASFQKVITERGKEEGETVEYQEMAPVVMYWGRNRLSINGITANSTWDSVQQQIDGLKFLLGVTMF